MTSLPDRPPNHLCLLPNTALKVSQWEPHPCGGWYEVGAWCWGPHGAIGYWVDPR